METLKVTFSSPQVVAPGQSVALQFDINLPNSGFFKFTLTQQAVPEPTMLSLLSLGGAALLVRRRRRQA